MEREHVRSGPVRFGLRGVAFGAALLVAAASPAADAADAAKKPWTIDEILRVRDVTDPQASPDGKRVAFVVSEASDETDSFNTDIYLAAIPAPGAPLAEAIQLTRSPKSDANPRWSPQGDRIAFISKRDPAIKSEDAGAQTWLMRPDGGEPWQAASIPGSVDDLAWSPDGTKLALIVAEPPTADRKKRDKDKNDWTVVDSEFSRGRVWLVDVLSGAAVQASSGGVHVTEIDWFPDGARLALAGQPTPRAFDEFNANIYTLDLTKPLAALAARSKDAVGVEPSPILPAPCSCTSPRVAPDGATIAFVTTDASREWYMNNYVATVRPTGAGLKLLTRSFDEIASDISFTPDGRFILFQANTRLVNHIYRVPAAGGRMEPLTKGDDVYRTASVSRNGRALVFIHESPLEPMEVHALDITPEGFPGSARPVTALNGWAREMATLPKEPFHWKGADGLDMEGVLVRPAGLPAGAKAPLLTIVHGGPAGSFANNFSARRGAYPIQLFAQKGFAVFMPNPRGSGAYGEEFRAANVRDWGEKDYVDIMSGIDELVAKGIADGARLGIMGWSYGGFMTSRVLTKTKQFAAASVGAAVTDTVSFTATTDIPHFMRSYFGAWPWEDPAVYTGHTAVFNAKGISTPTLIQHGEADARVPVSQGWELYLALREQKVPVEFVTYPRQGHGFTEPKLIRDAMSRNLAWFSRWILGETSP
ncbi:MAG: S9 family peptidase [Acidobacteria bacterium]|nr:S9 family peptidase [Acidobacteriota bacterium]